MLLLLVYSSVRLRRRNRSKVPYFVNIVSPSRIGRLENGGTCDAVASNSAGNRMNHPVIASTRQEGDEEKPAQIPTHT